MKIRLGFVSNSSSTSFCIYGMNISGDNLKEIFEVEDEDDFDPGNDLDVFFNEDGSEVYIGRSLMDCKDDETMGNFKKKIIDDIKKSSKKPIDDNEFDYFEESFYL